MPRINPPSDQEDHSPMLEGYGVNLSEIGVKNGKVVA